MKGYIIFSPVDHWTFPPGGPTVIKDLLMGFWRNRDISSNFVGTLTGLGPTKFEDISKQNEFYKIDFV